MEKLCNTPPTSSWRHNLTASPVANQPWARLNKAEGYLSAHAHWAPKNSVCGQSVRRSYNFAPLY